MTIFIVIPLAIKFFLFFSGGCVFPASSRSGQYSGAAGYSAILFTKLGSLFSYNLLSSFKGVE